MSKNSGHGIKEKEIELLQQQLREVKSQLVRTLADYDNLRKRIESEKIVWEKVAASKAVLKFLPVFDMILDAQRHLKDPGLEIVIGEFRKSLYELGVEEIRVEVGDKFNPINQEVTEMVAGGKEGQVAEVVQIGWKISGEEFIIRPAKVKVYKVSN